MCTGKYNSVLWKTVPKLNIANFYAGSTNRPKHQAVLPLYAFVLNSGELSRVFDGLQVVWMNKAYLEAEPLTGFKFFLLGFKN
jgi:hypothetical protein